MKLSIIIVNWNTVALLDQCLKSICRSRYFETDDGLEVLVVDNASTDNSAQHVRDNFPWVDLLETTENMGFARANNEAIRQSSGEYVLLLNPDTELEINTINTLMAHLEAHEAVGAAGPRVLNPDGTLQTSCYPSPTLSGELWRLFHLDTLWPHGVYRMDKWPTVAEREVDVLLGACLLTRREVLKQVGLLDEDYFMYSEEVDWCYRVREAGWHIHWVPSAQIVHYGGQSTQQVPTEMFLQLYSGKLHYFRKNHGRLAGLVYKIILLGASLSRLVLTPLAWLEGPVQRHQHLTLANRYWRLVASLPGL